MQSPNGALHPALCFLGTDLSVCLELRMMRQFPCLPKRNGISAGIRQLYNPYQVKTPNEWRVPLRLPPIYPLKE